MENKRGGFTLVEVMTVILLFGMLMLLIFPMRRMMVRVLERTGDQEHAEMIGDAVFLACGGPGCRQVRFGAGIWTSFHWMRFVRMISCRKFQWRIRVDPAYLSGSRCLRRHGSFMRDLEIFFVGAPDSSLK